jgi:hypothetical protein
MTKYDVNAIADITCPEAAKKKMPRVVDHLLYLLELHETNAIVLYSSTLSAQIPRSFAASAFNVFQRGLHQFEIVRLCALWDHAEPKKENIRTVIELIDHPDVIESLAQEAASHWEGIGGHIYNPSGAPELEAWAAEGIRQINSECGQEQAKRTRDELRNAIASTREILASQRYASMMNLRDKHLAHSLSETRREQKVGPLTPMKYGDETAVLNETLPIVEALYKRVCGAGFSFEDSRDIHRKNAKALWEVCTFKITE